MWMVVLTGCWWFPPTETSRSGMAGRVVDAAGTPMAGLLVETVESTERTDEDGAFGLYYKRPDTHVHFIHDGIWYRRRYVAADDGTVVQLQVPRAQPLRLDCGQNACDVEVVWDLGSGFTGKGRTRCEPEAQPVIKGAPDLEPSKVTCREGTQQPEKIVPEYVTGRLTLGAGPRDLTVSLVLDGATPARCEVEIDGQHRPTTGPPVILSAAGKGLARAVCDDRAAWPVAYGDDDTEVEVAWTPSGPELRLPPGMEYAHLRLAWPDGSLDLRPTRDGAFLLPPIPAGLYQVQLFEEVAPTATTGVEPVAREGVVVGSRLPSGAFVGVLEVATEVSEGTLPLETGP